MKNPSFGTINAFTLSTIFFHAPTRVGYVLDFFLHLHIIRNSIISIVADQHYALMEVYFTYVCFFFFPLTSPINIYI